MLRLYFKLTVVMFSLVIVPSLLIQSQSYDNYAIRALLTPEGCPMPCFMGIRPGMTTVREAEAILKQNNWIQDVIMDGPAEDTGTVSWSWKGNAPSILHFTMLPRGSGRMLIAKDLVQDIVVMTNILPGDLWLGWGQPSLYEITPLHTPPGVQRHLAVTAVYHDQGFWFNTSLTNCPYYPRMWQNGMTIVHWTNLNYITPFQGAAFASDQFMQTIMSKAHDDCRD